MTKLKHTDDREWGIASTASMHADQIRNRNDTDISGPRIRSLWADGYSNAQIATKLNVSALDVKLALGRYDGGAV